MFRNLLVFVIFILTISSLSNADTGGLDGVDVFRDGEKPTEILGIKPSVVYITTPRLTPLAPDLRMMNYLLKELKGQANGAVVVYGEDPKVVVGFAKRMGFPVFPAIGDIPEEMKGEEGGLPITLLFDASGNLVENRPYSDVPDAYDVTMSLGLDYDPGQIGPPMVGSRLPNNVVMASDKNTYEIDELIENKEKTIVYIIDLDDEQREKRLTHCQYLQDDLGENVRVLPIIIGASKLKANRLADAYILDLPVVIGSPLLAYNTVGNAKLPLLIILDEEGKVELISENAEIPNRNDILAEEWLPADEGPEIPYRVHYLSKVTDNLKSNVISTASWTVNSEDLVFNGRYDDQLFDNIFIISRAGKDLHQISHNLADDVFPSCSANGKHITFTSTRSGKEEVWLSELIHGEFTQITKYDGDAEMIRFGKAGELVVFQRRTDGDKYDLWLMTPIGRRARPVAETPFNELNANFDNAEDLLVFQSDRYENYDIFATDLDGGKRHRLTTDSGNDITPSLSQDGKYVVWSSNRDSDNYDIWIMNIDGSSKTRLTETDGDDLYPSFSPNNRFLSFTNHSETNSDIFKITFAPIPDYEGLRPPRYIRKAKSVYKDKYGDDDNFDWLNP